MADDDADEDAAPVGDDAAVVAFEDAAGEEEVADAAFAESLPTAFLSRTGRARIVSSPTPKLPPILNTAARFPEPDFFPRRNCAPTPSAR